MLSSSFRFVFLVIWLLHDHLICNAQSEQLIFSDSFSSLTWSWDTTIYNVYWLPSNDPYCIELGGTSCIVLNAGSYMWKTISLEGYNNVRVVLDSRESGIDSGEACYMRYSGTSSSWISTEIADSSGGLRFDLSYSIPSTFNNDANFQLEFGNSANGGSDLCFMDNLRIYGYPITDNPTPAPTPSPINTPTTSPSKVPTQPPSTGPTASPTRHPSDAPTQSPSASPSNPPTAYGYIAPTGMPTTVTSMPSASPSVQGSRNPSVAPSETETTEFPTVSSSRLCCGCLIASSRTPVTKGCAQDRKCEYWVCNELSDSYCCDSDWDENCVAKQPRLAPDGCSNAAPADSSTSTDQDTQQILIYAGIAVVLFVCVMCTVLVFCFCFCMKRKSKDGVKNEQERTDRQIAKAMALAEAQSASPIASDTDTITIGHTPDDTPRVPQQPPPPPPPQNRGAFVAQQQSLSQMSMYQYQQAMANQMSMYNVSMNKFGQQQVMNPVQAVSDADLPPMPPLPATFGRNDGPGDLDEEDADQPEGLRGRHQSTTYVTESRDSLWSTVEMTTGRGNRT